MGRAALARYRSILEDVQEGRCLYCERGLGARVDHFIPWRRYPTSVCRSTAKILSDLDIGPPVPSGYTLSKKARLGPDLRGEIIRDKEWDT